ncbi:hypothetical protein [Streptomyces sp. NPDC002232]|uniref:hypothetical protein n=1 Tax=Streptomyces sp. NPDC002232 TaxID=3364640 RepID=UPI00368A116A
MVGLQRQLHSRCSRPITVDAVAGEDVERLVVPRLSTVFTAETLIRHAFDVLVTDATPRPAVHPALPHTYACRSDLDKRGLTAVKVPVLQCVSRPEAKTMAPGVKTPQDLHIADLCSG